MGAQSEELRKEALQLFTLSDMPNLASLNDKYNRSKRRTALAHNEPYTDIDTTPYLTSFFNALIAELYADPYFKQQMSETLQLRAARSMQHSLLDVVALLQQIGETLEHDYTAGHSQSLEQQSKPTGSQRHSRPYRARRRADTQDGVSHATGWRGGFSYSRRVYDSRSSMDDQTHP